MELGKTYAVSKDLRMLKPFEDGHKVILESKGFDNDTFHFKNLDGSTFCFSTRWEAEKYFKEVKE